MEYKISKITCRNAVLIGLSLLSGACFSEQNCASLNDPNAMFACVMKERNKNINSAPPVDYTPKANIDDWKEVAEFAQGKAKLYFSKKSATFKEISDQQSSTGSSRVVIVNTLQDFKEPIEDAGNLIKSNLITSVYHCERNGAKEMRYEAHSENMGGGKIISINQEPKTKKWEPYSEGDDIIANQIRNLCPSIGATQGDSKTKPVSQQATFPNESSGFELVCNDRAYQGKRKPIQVDCNSWSDFTNKLGRAWKTVREQAQRDLIPRSLEDNCWKPYEKASQWSRDDHFGRSFMKQYPTPSTFVGASFNQCNIALKYVK